MGYREAVRALERAKENFELPVTGAWTSSRSTSGTSPRHVKRPVIVYDYPKDIKPFYMRVNDDDRTVTAMDVLAPGIGEIVGGSQREERLDVLDTRMAERGIDKDQLSLVSRSASLWHGSATFSTESSISGHVRALADGYNVAASVGNVPADGKFAAGEQR